MTRCTIISRFGAYSLVSALVKILTDFPVREFPFEEDVFADMTFKYGEPVSTESDNN